jgi:hypothetical protein
MAPRLREGRAQPDLSNTKGYVDSLPNMPTSDSAEINAVSASWLQAVNGRF